MKRRIPNIVFALIIGFAIALLTTPQRIRDFTDPANQTIDRLIAQDFGLDGAVTYHIVVSTVLFTIIAAILLTILRRPPKPQAPPSTTSLSSTAEGSPEPGDAPAQPRTDSREGPS